MKFTTQHPTISYSGNVEVIAQALREQLGVEDYSYLTTAIAAHIWSHVCGQWEESKTWSEAEVKNALADVQARLTRLQTALDEATRRPAA